MPCTNCMAKYTTLRKENGCSNCGYGFCQKCLTKKFSLPRLSKKPVPVCDGCFKSLSGETVQPLEKSRGESNDKDQWWGSDEKPPPSLRNMYPIKSKISNNKAKNEADLDNDAQLAERLAKLTNKSVEQIKHPSYMISDCDDGEIPTSSREILSNLRQPSDLTTINKPPSDNISMESLEERLAALRNVPVETIRKPRLMVINNEDSEPELDDDAKKLLQDAEQKLRKNEPDLFYVNEALDSD